MKTRILNEMRNTDDEGELWHRSKRKTCIVEIDTFGRLDRFDA